MAKARLIYIATDDGLRVFSDPGEIKRWLRAGLHWPGQLVEAIWVAPQQPLLVLAAPAGQALQRSDDGAQSWQPVLDRPIIALAGHEQDPALYAVDRESLLYRSIDAGVNWQRIAEHVFPAAGAIRQLLVASSDAGLLLAVLGDGSLWSSSDQGLHWQAQAPAGTAQTAFLSSRGVIGVLQPGMLAVQQSTGQWQQLPAPETLDPTVAPICLSGANEVWLAGATTGAVLRSENGGNDWQSIELSSGSAERLSVLVRAAYHPDTALLGTRAGLCMVSTDRGRNWQSVAMQPGRISALATVRLL